MGSQHTGRRSTAENALCDRLKNGLCEVFANRRCTIGIAILAPIVFTTVLAPVIAPHNPTETHMGAQFAAPGGEFLLGTDHLGRDLLSRVLYGGRSSLVLGFAAAGVSMLVGVPLGLASGYLGGRIDEGVMRLLDMLLSIPSLLLALLIVALLGSSLLNAVLAIAVVYTPRIARVVRSSTLAVKQEEFIKAAEARGESRVYICFGEILPNILSPIIVEGSIRIGFAILIGASLSFSDWERNRRRRTGGT